MWKERTGRPVEAALRDSDQERCCFSVILISQLAAEDFELVYGNGNGVSEWISCRMCKHHRPHTTNQGV